MIAHRPSPVAMTDPNHVPTIKQWDTSPDRESLRVTHRFLSRCETIESVSLEPCKTHPRLVRVTVSDQDWSTAPGILEVRWYETRDFVITYQTDRENDDPLFLRWTHPPDADEIKVSHSRSDNVQTLTPTSHHPGENRFHPLRVLPIVLATIEECSS